MRRYAPVALAALAVAFLGFGATAAAKLTPAQKLFTQKLLASPQVSPAIKLTLRKGGFVSSKVMFADLTGEGKADAVAMVDSGGAAGIVAIYVFSAGAGKQLKIVYRNQRLYRADARINPGPALLYVQPQYKDGDQLCSPSAYRATELKWSSAKKRFGVARRRTLAVY